MRSDERVRGGVSVRRELWLAAGLVVVGLLAVGLFVALLAAVRGGEPPGASAQEAEITGVFVRPGMIAPGGTYEIYIDATGAAFSGETVVEVASVNTAPLEVRVRNSQALTVVLGVAAAERLGELEVRVITPLDGRDPQAFEVSLLVEAPDATGPSVAVTNLPAGERIVAEGGFAHFELELEGNGPFVVEYGLRERSFWSSRVWNATERRVAEERGYAIEGPEVEAFTIPLPNKANIVDIVATDRNGYEKFQSLVVVTRKPCEMEKAKEVGLLDALFKRSVACASCGSDNPSNFTFYGVSNTVGVDYYRDDNGRFPLLFTGSTCQGTICSCCQDCLGTGCTLGLGFIGNGGGGGGGGGNDGSGSRGRASRGGVPLEVAPEGEMENRGGVFGHSGEYSYTVTDMRIAVPGLDFAITRTYRSQITYHSRFGRDWDSNIFARYLRLGTATGTSAYASGDLYFYSGNGRRDTYTHLGGTSFESPPGFYDKFMFNPTGGSQEFRKKDGSRWIFTETQIGSNAVFGRLSYIYDRLNTNYLRFCYDVNDRLEKISSSTGIDITIVYGGNGYIASIYQDEDEDHRVDYHYVMSTGETAHDAVLDYVEYPETTVYSYDGNGDLIGPYTDHRKCLAYGYDVGETGDLKYNLSALYDGRGNFDTTPANQPARDYPVLAVAYGQDDRVYTYTTDPQGNRTEIEFTSYEHGPDPGEPRTTTYTLTGYDSVTETADVVLKQVYMEYDPSMGGVTNKILKTGAGTPVATWHFERDCSCNAITKITDPYGGIEWREYDTYGNLTRRIIDDGDGNQSSDDIITLYKFDVPNYINAGNYGGLVARADPDVVSSPTDDIDDDVEPEEKTRYEYQSNGNLTKILPPVFYHHTDLGFGATDFQPERTYDYNSNGQVTLETVSLIADADESEGGAVRTVLRKRGYTYYSAADAKKGLLKEVIDDPDDGSGPAELALTTLYEYDNRRDVTKITDPKDQVTEYVRTRDRLIERITMPTSSEDDDIHFGYDANNTMVWKKLGGNVGAESYPFRTLWRYDAVNRVINVEKQVKWVSGVATTVETNFAYDGEGRVALVSETGGKRTRYDYGYVNSVWIERSYDSPSGGTETKLTETRSAATERNVETRAWYGSGPTEYSAAWLRYDDFGRLELRVTSPETNDVSSYGGAKGPNTKKFYAEVIGYDKNGSQVLFKRGEGSFTTSDNPLDKDDATYSYKHGIETEHDELGRPTKRTTYQDYAAQTGEIVVLTEYSYDGRVERRRKELPSGNLDVTFDYDAVSRVTAIGHADGESSTLFAYDENGNVERVTSREYDSVADGTKDYLRHYNYDELDRVIEEVIEGCDNAEREDPYQKTAYAYDYRGNLRQVTWDVTDPEEEDVGTVFLYDGLNRLVEATYDDGGLGISNAILYDDANRRVTMRDGRTDGSTGDHDTVYQYHDSLNLVTEITYPDDESGGPYDNLYMAYDWAGRLTYTRTAASGPPTAVSHDVAFAYDLLGRLKSRTVKTQLDDQETVAEYGYDYLDRVVSAKTTVKQSSQTYATEVTRTYNSLFLTQEVQKKYDTATTFSIRTTEASDTGYDSGGRRVRLKYPNNASLDSYRTLTFAYDDSDRLEQVKQDFVVTEITLAGYDYDGPGPRVRKTWYYAAGNPKIEKVVTYDHLKRPTSSEYKRYGSTRLVQYIEGWGTGEDKTAPIFSRTAVSDGSYVWLYTYDALGRLSTYLKSGTSSVSHGYDEAGNLTSKGPSGGVRTYSYTTSNELDEETTQSPIFDGFDHDARGNLTLKDRAAGQPPDQEFTYDIYNRLVTYEEGEESWHYYYDGFGRRVKKTDGSESHYYFYDGSRVVLELITEGQNTDVREYIYGLGLDEVVVEVLPDASQQGGVGWFWPLIDSHGTVRDLADMDGATHRRRVTYEYDAWGAVYAESQADSENPITQDVLFTGRWLDRETAVAVNGSGGITGAIYDFRSRNYDPEFGRFLQRDLIGVWGDAGNRGNGYIYPGNDAVNNRDPFGLCGGCSLPSIVESGDSVRAETNRDLRAVVADTIYLSIFDGIFGGIAKALGLTACADCLKRAMEHCDFWYERARAHAKAGDLSPEQFERFRKIAVEACGEQLEVCRGLCDDLDEVLVSHRNRFLAISAAAAIGAVAATPAVVGVVVKVGGVVKGAGAAVGAAAGTAGTAAAAAGRVATAVAGAAARGGAAIGRGIGNAAGAIGRVAGSVTGRIAGWFGGAGVAAIQACIRFGDNANQVYHAFRHVLDAGLSRAAVEASIRADLAANWARVGDSLNIRTITVAGQTLTYHAYRLADGVVNVGRITVK